MGFADIVSAAIVVKGTGGSSSVSWLVKPNMSDAVSRLCGAYDLPWLVHARDVVERLAWRLDNKSLDKTSVFNDIVLMAMFPELDPSCAAFRGSNDGVGEVGADGGKDASNGLTEAQGGILEALSALSAKVDEIDERTQGMSRAEKGIIELLKKMISK